MSRKSLKMLYQVSVPYRDAYDESFITTSISMPENWFYDNNELVNSVSFKNEYKFKVFDKLANLFNGDIYKDLDLDRIRIVRVLNEV